MNAVLRGLVATALIQGKVASSWSPVNGATTTINYRGLENLVVPYALNLQNNGWSTQIQQDGTGGTYTLTATYPEDLLTNNPSNPAPVWTIEPHAIERSLLECNDRNFIANLSTTTKALIEYAIKNPQTDPPLTTADETEQTADAQLAYTLMRLGVEARQEWTIALKRCLIVSRYYAPTWVLENNGLVLSKGFLVSDYGVDSATAAFMPNSSGLETDANGIDFMYGYLEQKPTRTTLPNNKVQLEQSWIFNKWSAGARGLYDIA